MREVKAIIQQVQRAYARMKNIVNCCNLNLQLRERLLSNFSQYYSMGAKAELLSHYWRVALTPSKCSYTVENYVFRGNLNETVVAAMGNHRDREGNTTDVY